MVKVMTMVTATTMVMMTTMVTVPTMVSMMTMVTATTMVTMRTMVTVTTMVTVQNFAFVSIIEKRTLNNAQIYYHVDQCDTDIFCFIVILSAFRRN